MKKLLMAFVLATVLAAVLRAIAGQRGGAGSAPQAEGGNGSHHGSGNGDRNIAERIDGSIEATAGELASASAGNGDDTEQDAPTS